MRVRKEYMRNGEAVSVTAERLDGDNWRVRIGERVLELTAHALGDGGIRIVSANPATKGTAIAYGTPAGKHFMVRINGHTHTLTQPTGRGRGGAGSNDGTILAPMSGTVLEVLCKTGDKVTADQTLVVLSAMKMEHKLAAGIAGTVRSVEVTADDTVDQGAALITVEAVATEQQGS